MLTAAFLRWNHYERVGNLCYFLKNKTMNTQEPVIETVLSAAFRPSLSSHTSFLLKRDRLTHMCHTDRHMIVSFTVLKQLNHYAHSLKVFTTKELPPERLATNLHASQDQNHSCSRLYSGMYTQFGKGVQGIFFLVDCL